MGITVIVVLISSVFQIDLYPDSHHQDIIYLLNVFLPCREDILQMYLLVLQGKRLDADEQLFEIFTQELFLIWATLLINETVGK